jgi:hypothetical protein
MDQALMPIPTANNTAAAGSGTVGDGRAPSTAARLVIAIADPASVSVITAAAIA